MAQRVAVKAMASTGPSMPGRVTGTGRGVRTPASPETTQQQSPFSLIESHAGDVQSKAGTGTSVARHNFHERQESQLNAHINVEFTASYTYHWLYSHFNRDDVGLPGAAKFFKAMSEEERGHAEQFMTYQNTRGGRVELFPVQLPPTPDLESTNGKSDLQSALEFALAVEKFTYQKLIELHNVADECGDPQMCDFIESNFLQEQVDSIKSFADYVSIAARVGGGLGAYYLDQQLAQAADQQ